MWHIVIDVINPSLITYVGLRYINRIERSEQNETLGAWFEPNDYMASALFDSYPGFLSVVQKKYDLSNRVNVIVGEMDSPNVNRAFFI